MSLLAVRTAIVTSLQDALPAGVSVESHRGRFDSAAEIKRFATKAPAVLVACVRSKLDDACEGMPILHASWAVFVITRDKPSLPRDEGALALVEAIALSVSGNTWALDDTSAPTAIDSRNLYSGAVDNLGVALWAVTFEQTVTNPAIDDATLATMGVFATFHQDIDMAPADGQIDITETDTLPQ